MINIIPRALGGPDTITTNAMSVSVTASSTTDRPFFPDPTSYVQPTEPADQKHDLAKSVLEWLFLVIALILITGVILRRFQQLRHANQPLSRFFGFSSSWSSSRRRSNFTSLSSNMHSFPRTGQMHSSNPNSLLYPYYPYPSIATPPNAYVHSSRRTRAADLDEGGRRLGGGGANDHDGEPDDKDVLPVYDTVGSPPKYIESEMHAIPPRFSEMVPSVPVGEQRATGGQDEDAERENRGNGC